jgi:hypothetical protein
MHAPISLDRPIRPVALTAFRTALAAVGAVLLILVVLPALGAWGLGTKSAALTAMVGSRPAGSLVSIGPAARTPSLGATGSCHVRGLVSVSFGVPSANTAFMHAHHGHARSIRV